MDELVRFSSPFSHPWHFLAMELCVLATSVLVLLHAVERYRAGDKRHLFQWLAFTSYGIQMELVAFNFLDNYEHAQFTVQLYGGQLPLYVTGLYGTFLYVGTKLAERLDVHPFAEACLAGFATCLVDVPFDLAGMAVGWWTWLDTDPNLAYRWLGVPVTSYEWYLIFGVVAALLCRGAWRLVEKRPFAVATAVALPVGTLVIVFGVLAFIPFHVLAGFGLSHGTLVAAHLAACAVLAVAVRSRAAVVKPTDRLVAIAALLIPVLQLVVLGTSFGSVDDAGVRLAWSLASVAGLAAIVFALPIRRAASAPVPAVAVTSEVAS